jgi:hypothetical protein
VPVRAGQRFELSPLATPLFRFRHHGTVAVDRARCDRLLGDCRLQP